MKRHLISLWRNKSGFIIELIACSVTFFVYTLFMESFIKKDYSDFKMNKLLTDTKVFYLVDENFKKKNNFNPEEYMNINNNLWGSEFYFSEKKINFVDFATEFNLKSTEYSSISLEDLDNLVFRNSVYHNIKGILYFKESIDPLNKFSVNVLFNPAAMDYSFVLKSWIFSNFFKNELGLNTDLLVILIYIFIL